MKRPELLRFDLAAKTEANVFEDLQINKVFTGETISLIAYICDSSEIKRRQSVFSALENRAFFDMFSDLSEKISSFERNKVLLAEVKSGFEQIWLKLSLLEKYLGICDAASRLKGICSCIVTDEYADFFLSAESMTEQKAISADIAGMRGTVSGISDFCLSFGDKNWLSKDYSPEPYLCRLERCAAALGIEVSDRKSFSLRANEALSDAYIKLFEKEIDEICFILKKYEAVMSLDFSGDRAALAFYTEIKELLDRAGSLGIPHTLPVISERRLISIDSLYDITLLAKETKCIVPNDAEFDEAAPFFFLTGANGGGKTTYLRALGVNLLLFMSGCPIFAERAEIYPFRTLALHFPVDERFTDTGRLEDEQKRVKNMLEGAGPDSVLLFNETFSGTDDRLGAELTLSTAEKMRKSSAFGLFVTHFHDVSEHGYPMLQAVVENTPTEQNKRVYRIVRADKRTGSFAKDILKKYSLDRRALAERYSKTVSSREKSER